MIFGISPMVLGGARRDMPIVVEAFADQPSVTTPSIPNIRNGDLLVAVVTGGSLGTSYTAPAGWTLRQSGNSRPASAVFTRIASGETGAGYTFTSSATSTTRSIAVAVIIYSGFSGALTIGSVLTENSATNHPASGISPSSSGILLGWWGIEAAADILTAPAGMTLRAFVTVPTRIALRVYELDPSAAGATGDKTVTFSESQRATCALIHFAAS
jgi:hypothetical protein